MRIVADAKHVVAKGDSLTKLSWDYYGHPEGAAWIWLENLEAIGHDPDNLNPGTVLTIPTVETREVKKSVWAGGIALINRGTNDPRLRVAIRYYGASWRLMVFRLFAANGGSGNLPTGKTTFTFPPRGAGYAIEAARRRRLGIDR